MNQYLLYGLIGFALLLVALVIPGLKVVAEALFKLLMDLFKLLLEHKGKFIVWLVKTLSADHSRVFQHAAQSRDTLDPTEKVRRKAEGYDD